MSNLPMKKKKGFVAKIKNFVRRLLYSNKELPIMETLENNNNNIIDSTVKNENFISAIKLETNPNKVIKEMQSEKERESLLDEINKNPKILDRLSFEKLQKLDEYCNITINKYRDKLKKLQNAN